jgi:hypothetical protein
MIFSNFPYEGKTLTVVMHVMIANFATVVRNKCLYWMKSDDGV